MEKCYDFEKKNGMERITKAVTNAMKINDNDSLIVQYIKEHTPENAIVFLTGIGKCYPILRSHKVLNNLHQAFVRCPVVMFFPGTYNEQELILFNEIKDDNLLPGKDSGKVTVIATFEKNKKPLDGVSAQLEFNLSKDDNVIPFTSQTMYQVLVERKKVNY